MQAILTALKAVFAALRQLLFPIWSYIVHILNWIRRLIPWTDPSADPIKHVFVLMLENHSFDQMLGSLRDEGALAALDGVDPAALRSNADAAGNRYYQRASTEDRAPFDPNHEYEAVIQQLADSNGGFVRNLKSTHKDATTDQLQSVMDYFPKGALPALHWLAENFTVCDHWFSSVPGPTWTNRLFLLSGTSMGRVEMGSLDHPMGFFGYDQQSIFNLLEDRRIPWRVYFHDFPQSWLLDRQLTPAMAANYYPMANVDEFEGFESDLRREGEDFPRFCFIEPQYFWPGQNDDHPTSSALPAQQLIARVYNAIRGQDAIWNSSLLVVLYDEHGGFFDHVTPPAATPPMVPDDYPFHDRGVRCDFRTLGLRVPAVLVSPWVGHSLCQTQFDHTTVLKYLCDKWRLECLTARAEQAAQLGNLIRRQRREIRNDSLIVPAMTAEVAVEEGLPPDDTEHQRALRGLMEKIEREHQVQLQPLPAADGVPRPRAAGSSNEMRQRTLEIARTIRANG